MKSCGTIQIVGSCGAICVCGGTFTSSSMSIMAGGCSGPCTESGASPLSSSSVSSLANSKFFMALGSTERCAMSGASMQRSSIKRSSDSVGLIVGRKSANTGFSNGKHGDGGRPSTASSPLGGSLPLSGSAWLRSFGSRHILGTFERFLVLPQPHSACVLLRLIATRPPRMQQLTTITETNAIPIEPAAIAEASSVSCGIGVSSTAKPSVNDEVTVMLVVALKVVSAVVGKPFVVPSAKVESVDNDACVTRALVASVIMATSVIVEVSVTEIIAVVVVVVVAAKVIVTVVVVVVVVFVIVIVVEVVDGVVVGVVVGHPWPLNLQHHRALGVDHAVPVGEQSNVVVLVVVVDVLTTFSTARQPSLRCWQHQLRFSTDQSWGLPAVGLVQSNTGQPTPLCLQHQSCLCRDQVMVSPPAGIVQSGRAVDVVVGGQPTPSWLQHHRRCDGVHNTRGLPSSPSAAAAAALQVSCVVVVGQPRPSCLQHQSFFDRAQAASQLFNAA
mmetsp:Transcript_31365/g.61593  ORF Transcript_31365/g.61593 Transcript_31365/m.61593 type:complete len:500 (-) Transcript_31365:367-1866(-)